MILILLFQMKIYYSFLNLIYYLIIYYSFKFNINLNNVIPIENILFFSKSNLLSNYLFYIYFINSGDI